MSTLIKSYNELRKFDTLEDRFKYLSLKGTVGERTFGSDRYINQRFYTSHEWKQIRNFVITRDNGCDLGIEEFPIHSKPLIHHMNPIALTDLTDFNEAVLDPQFLITTSLQTHNAIHYGDSSQIPQPYVERKPGDTRSW